jgi:hypothetical protein
MEEAKRIDNPRESKVVEAPFAAPELTRYLNENGDKLPAGFDEIRSALQGLALECESWMDKLEELEQRLTALEEKMVAIARSRQSEEQILHVRKQLESQLKPYRGKMAAAELMMIEKKFLDQRLLEDSGLPRLSLFYLA